MAPAIADLQQNFNIAFGDYIEAMHASKRAVEAAMQNPDLNVRKAYLAATRFEGEKRQFYVMAANALHEALVSRPQQR
jgi:hypothetical protein